MTCQLIRNVCLNGRLLDIAISNGRIRTIGTGLKGEELLDARGGAAVAGLHDHHAHLLATAAELGSVALDQCAGADDVTHRLRTADNALAPGLWLRATGYHERLMGALDRHVLDGMVGARPLRVQHQSGALWMLNSAAIARLGSGPWPAGVECDMVGSPTGRIFRCDGWLGETIGRTAPDLAMLGRILARSGVTGITDASITTDAAGANLLADAVRSGALSVRLHLMSGGELEPPADGAYSVGPVKILLDDHDLPPVDDLVGTIARARRWGRPVAAHCVTAGELAVMLAAFTEAGSRPGDRIEHGGIIPIEAIPLLRTLNLAVVTQPAFIATRGDRYRVLVDPAEQGDLYRCASLLDAGVPVAGSSDAPYAPMDPWLGIRAAIQRTSADGHALGFAERLEPALALSLYLSPLEQAGGPPRRIEPGARADICVLAGSLDAALADPGAHHVQATVMAGRLVWSSAHGHGR